jgi:tetratricopeptide (TPR) repeat protein
MSTGAELSDLWDFDDPLGSEVRFRQAADEATDEAGRQLAMTQVARALGLQERFDDAHAVLDSLRPVDAEVDVRRELERGRLLRSAGQEGASRPHFEGAAKLAAKAGLEELHVDALHMRALVLPREQQLAATMEAVAFARAATDPRARDWDASLLNNLGMIHADDGDFDQALEIFQDALTARERIGDPETVRIARWMVAWALRNVGRSEEALEMQLALKAELDAAARTDTYVDEELRVLMGDRSRAPSEGDPSDSH